MPRKRLVYTKIPVIVPSKRKIRFCSIPVISGMRRTHSDITNPLPENVSGKILGNLYLEKLLSTGDYGVLFRALDLDDGLPYAVKIMIPNETVQETFDDEVAAYQLLSTYPECNEYIVCLYDSGSYEGAYYRDIHYSKEFRRRFRQRKATQGKKMIPLSGKYLYLKQELMDMDLFTWIDMMEEMREPNKTSGTRLTFQEKHPHLIWHIMYELLRGLEALHQAHVAHLDIKPENILVRFSNQPFTESARTRACAFLERPNPEHMAIKLGDLGFVCTDKKHQRSEEELLDLSLCRAMGTPATTSPELLDIALKRGSRRISLSAAQKADIWSLGITFGELVYPHPAFNLPHAAENYLKDGDQDTYIDEYNTFMAAGETLTYASAEKDMNDLIHDVIIEMLDFYPQNRPTAKELLDIYFGVPP